MTKNEGSKPVNRILPKSKRSAAIAWAAKKQEISYGKLMLELTDQQKSKIYKEYGYQIPSDVSIIGVDNTMLAQISSPALSSIQIGCATMGQQAINLLLEQIDKPTDVPLHVHIGSRLVLRASSVQAEK